MRAAFLTSATLFLMVAHLNLLWRVGYTVSVLACTVGRWHNPSVVAMACIEFLIVYGVAALSYRFIESPILSLKRYAKYRNLSSPQNLPRFQVLPVSD